MKKVLILILALGLGACSVVDTLNGVKLAVTGVPNPVTKTMLYDLENVAIITFSGLGAYKASCQKGALPSSCRAVVANLQTYTRRFPPVVRDLRAFVKNNDQVNAAVAYDTAKQLITDFRTVAVANNVQVQ